MWQVSASLGRPSFIGLDIWIPCREDGSITQRLLSRWVIRTVMFMTTWSFIPKV